MGSGAVMSDTLDRLKALNDRLELKLSNISDTVSYGDESAGAISVTQAEEIQNEEIRCEKLADSILEKMSIDPDTEGVRAKNIHTVAKLYRRLSIHDKAPDFDDIFIYKAMNISGIGLKEDDFGEVREGKYVQIIAITYEPDKNGKKKAKNISLSYFGKAEKLSEEQKKEIIEFVLRWRYEKAFQNLEHYKDLLGKISTMS